MSDPAPQPWTIDQFFAWQAGQPDRYELVGGFPVRMMAGARNVHDDIVVNLVSELRAQLRGSDCRPFTGDGCIETLPGQIRRPDVGVDCGRRDPDGLKAELPRMVIEVLSPTTRDFDVIEKVAEYKQVESLEYLLLVEPNAAEVIRYFRDANGLWSRHVVAGLDQVVELPALTVSLTMAEIYDGVQFPTRPRLVREGD